MSEVIFSISVLESGETQRDSRLPTGSFPALKREIMRGAIVRLSEQCVQWGVPILDLLTAEELSELKHQLAQREGKAG